MGLGVRVSATGLEVLEPAGNHGEAVAPTGDDLPRPDTDTAVWLIVADDDAITLASANIQSVLGWTESVLAGCPLLMVLDPQEAPMHTARLRGVRSQRCQDEYITRVRTAFGNFQPMRILLLPYSSGSTHATLVKLSEADDIVELDQRELLREVRVRLPAVPSNSRIPV